MPQEISTSMSDVDTVLQQAVSAGDPLILVQEANRIISSMRVRGVALAKLFYGWRSNWKLFQAAGIQEEFVDFIAAHVHIAPRTAVKYADMYETVMANEEIPLYIREQLQLKPIQSLLLLTAGVKEGDLGPEELEDAILLDHKGIRNMVREVRGDVTNSTRAVYARLVREKGRSYPPGTIVVFGRDEDGHENIEAIGSINLTPHTRSGVHFVDRVIRLLGLEEMSYDESI